MSFSLFQETGTCSTVEISTCTGSKFVLGLVPIYSTDVMCYKVITYNLANDLNQFLFEPLANRHGAKVKEPKEV